MKRLVDAIQGKDEEIEDIDKENSSIEANILMSFQTDESKILETEGDQERKGHS